MLYLLLAIFCSSSIALIFKYSEGNAMNRMAVTSANYFIAFIVSLIMALSNKSLSFNAIELTGNFSNEFKTVILQNNGQFSFYSSLIWAGVLGFITGVFFYLSFVYYQKSVKENGAGISGAFAKIGILIPMILSIILWRELPTSLQWIGIFLALLSIFIVNFSFDMTTRNYINKTLILLFLFGGIGEFQNKLFQTYSQVITKDVFLFFVFFTAFLISLYSTFKGNKKISLKDLMIGILVGIPNLFSSYFLILALTALKTSIVFPIYSAGSILLINIGSFIIFKEKLTKKQLYSVALTILALILINI